MKRFRPLRAGFSLIEVNMAIFVLAGGALALLGLFPMGLRESNDARNEMRTATFAEKFLGAAQAAAQDPEVTDVETLASAISALDIECETFNGTVSESITTHKDDSGVWFQAWVLDDADWTERDTLPSDITVVEVGIRVTADNADQNPYAMKVAPIYAARIFLDGRD